MQSQPAEAPRGRNVQTARPSSRREALSDTSSDEESDGDSTETDEEGEDDEGQAAGMDFSEDAQIGGGIPSDPVHFARHHGSSHGHASIKQSHNATLNDNDDAEVEQVSSPEGTRGTLSQPDFEYRPANAASVGREKGSLPIPEHKKGKQANAALPVDGKNVKTNSSDPLGSRKSNTRPSVAPGRKRPERTNLLEDRAHEDSSDGENHLFDSPYMPSSPKITSSSNLGGLLANSEMPDPYTLTWADKEERMSSQAEDPVTQSSVKSAQGRSPSWLGKRHKGGRRFDSLQAGQSEDELSDPANNGYSYGYGFDEDDDDQKGYVAKATDLLGALWNVGTGMVWGRAGEGDVDKKASARK